MTLKDDAAVRASRDAIEVEEIERCEGERG
jgi:hypothetical protein